MGSDAPVTRWTPGGVIGRQVADDESVYEDVRRYNQSHYASFSTLLQTQFDDAVVNFDDDSVDLLHIDGLQTYEAVRHDFDTWFPKVRTGGFVLLHGTAARENDSQVWRLWKELADFPHFEFAHSRGLGVLRKPGASSPARPELEALLPTTGEEETFLRHYYALQAELLEHRHRREIKALQAERVAAVTESRDAIVAAALAERDLALARAHELGAELKGLQAERVAATTDYRRVHTENEALVSESASLRTLLAEAQARSERELAQLEDELRNARAEFRAVIASNSWRLTAPLRWFRQFGRYVDVMTTPDRSPGGSLPVTIVIPAYGAAAQLWACLASLVKHAPARCEIVVADDATPDDSIAEVVREFEPQLSLVYIRRERNLGFVENCNEAIGTSFRAATTSCSSTPIPR